MATVSSSPRTTTVTLASATAGPFDVGFRVFETDSLTVYLNGTELAGWTMSTTFVNGYDDGATLTLPSVAAIGDVLVVDGDQVVDRQADYLNGDPGLTASLNNELARYVAGLSETKRDSKRSIRALTDLKPFAPVANAVLAFGADSQPVAGPTIDAIASAQQNAEDVAEIAEKFGDVDQAITASQDARDLSQKWAENPEDDAVVPGEYSALHHAAKSAESAGAAAGQATIATTQAGLADTARQAAELAGAAVGTFTTQAQGITATANGQYFWSPEGATAGYLQFYKNVSGTATAQTSTVLPLKATIETEVQRGQYARDLSKVAISNGYLNTSGVFVGSGAWRCTDNIPCAEGDTINYSLWGTSGTAVVAFYTSGGALISKILSTGGGAQVSGTARAPATVAAVRFSSGSSAINQGNAQTYSVLAYTPTVLAEQVAAAANPIELAPLAVIPGYIDKTTGAAASDNNWLHSDFFECQPGDYLTYSLWGNGAVGSLTFHDANKAHISSISGGTTTAGVVTPPATTRYGRLCYGAPSIAGSFVNTCVIQRTTGHSLAQLDDRLSTVEQAVDDIVNYVAPEKKISNLATRIIGLRNTNSLDNTTIGTLQTLMEVAAQFSEVQLIFAAPSASGSYTISDCAVSTSATRDLNDNNNAASWVPVTFDGADAGVVPAAPGGNRVSYLLSDWIDLASAARSDGGTGGIVVSRAYISTAASIPMASIQGSTPGISALATRTDGHRTFARWQAGDHVSTLTGFTSTTNLYTLGMVGIRYKAKGVVITILLSGDSINEGQKATPWGDSFGVPISHSRTNPAGVAYEVANIAWAGSTTGSFTDRLQDYLDAGMSADIAFLTGGSGNDTGSGTVTLTDANIISMAAHREASVALMKANEILPIVFTWGPYGTGLFNYGSSDWRRVADNASILMQAQGRDRWAVDFNQVLYDSTNSDGQQLPDMTLIADGWVHPNAAGYAAMAGAANVVLDRILNVSA